MGEHCRTGGVCGCGLKSHLVGALAQAGGGASLGEEGGSPFLSLWGAIAHRHSLCFELSFCVDSGAWQLRRSPWGYPLLCQSLSGVLHGLGRALCIV